MFVINPLPPQVAPELTDLLAKAEPATIGHFLDFGFMDPEIRALLPGGVPVMPDDAILADENGILVLKPDQIEAVATRAISKQLDEARQLKTAPKGAKLPDLNGTNQRLREILAAQAKTS